MNQKFPLRVLVLLLTVTIGVVGFFFYRSKTLQAASNANPSLLKDLKLNENISVRQVFLYTFNPADYVALEKKGTAPLGGNAENKKLQKVLLHVVGKQLRSGEVKFAPIPPLQEDGYRPPPSQEEQKAGSLSLTPDLNYVKGVYTGHIRLQLDQHVSLEGASSPVVLPTWSEDSLNFSTTSEAEIIPKFQAEAQRLTTNFVRAYREANNLPVPEISGGGGLMLAPAPASPAKRLR